MKLTEALQPSYKQKLIKFNLMLLDYQRALSNYIKDDSDRNATELKKQGHFMHLIHGDSFKEVENILQHNNDI